MSLISDAVDEFQQLGEHDESISSSSTKCLHHHHRLEIIVQKFILKCLIEQSLWVDLLGLIEEM